MAPIDAELDLAPVVETLSSRFAGVADRDQINELVVTAAAQFAAAPIRDYVPVLVQHLCADRLRQLSAA
jgi:hypothetical protein